MHQAQQAHSGSRRFGMQNEQGASSISFKKVADVSSCFLDLGSWLWNAPANEKIGRLVGNQRDQHTSISSMSTSHSSSESVSTDAVLAL